MTESTPEEKDPKTRKKQVRIITRFRDKDGVKRYPWDNPEVSSRLANEWIKEGLAEEI